MHRGEKQILRFERIEKEKEEEKNELVKKKNSLYYKTATRKNNYGYMARTSPMELALFFGICVALSPSWARSNLEV